MFNDGFKWRKLCQTTDSSSKEDEMKLERSVWVIEFRWAIDCSSALKMGLFGAQKLVEQLLASQPVFSLFFFIFLKVIGLGNSVLVRNIVLIRIDHQRILKKIKSNQICSIDRPFRSSLLFFPPNSCFYFLFYYFLLKALGKLRSFSPLIQHTFRFFVMFSATPRELLQALPLLALWSFYSGALPTASYLAIFSISS